jgi:hypothetical protein
MVAYMEESGEQFTVVFALKLRVQYTLHYTVSVVHCSMLINFLRIGTDCFPSHTVGISAEVFLPSISFAFCLKGV